MTMKKTILTERICEILQDSKSPKTRNQLFEILSDSAFKCAKSTVYRVLDRLENEGLLLHFDSNNVSYYEWKNKNNHLHLICNSCDEIRCLDNNFIESTLKTIKNNINSFNITGIDLKASGFCNNCTN